MDLKIDHLVVEEDRIDHIAKHKVSLEEVLEVISGDYMFVRATHDRWQLVGRTKQDKFLTIIIGERKQKNTYGLVTARPASRKERAFYHEYTYQIGGELDE